jgi:hypothetical protein
VQQLIVLIAILMALGCDTQHPARGFGPLAGSDAISSCPDYLRGLIAASGDFDGVRIAA